MNLTEPPERSISTPTAGLFAVLGDLLCVSGSGAPKIASRTVLVLATILAALALTATPAMAFEKHVFSQSIGEGVKGAGTGQLELASNSGVAVNDTTGNIYVADTGNHRIDEFESHGSFVRAWGWGVANGLPMFETCGPGALPPTVTCQAGISGSGAGQFTTPTFVAVDNSASASKGGVYVGDTGNNLVTKFSSEGVLESTWGDTAPTPNGQLAGKKTTSGSLGEIDGIAVDSNGNLDVLSGSSQFFKFAQEGAFSEEFEVARGTLQDGLAVDAEGNIFKINGSPTVEEITNSDSDVGQVTIEASPDVGLGVDTSTGDLYVGTSTEVEEYVFSAPGVVGSCAVESFVGCPPTISFGSGDISAAAGLAVDSSTDTVYVADTSTSRIDVFVPVIIPDVATLAPAAVKAHSATLVGTVDPDKEGAAKCQFVWGTTKEFGQTATCEPAEVPEGDTPVPVEAKLGELQPDTTYYYRLQATNKNGTNTGQQYREFTTAGPGVHGESASDVTASSVTLNASINPNNGPLSAVPNAPASYYFQYSLESTEGCEASPSSCTSVPVAPGEAIGPGESDLEVSQHVQGLLAGAVYHFRVVALSEVAGELATVAGPDQTFTTQVAGGGLVLSDERQWELVSPPDKHGALLLPMQEGGSVVQAAVGGDAMTFLASAPTEGEPPGYSEEEQVLSARGPDGWVSRDISPPHEHVAPLAVGQGQEYVAFSEDLSLAVLQPHGPFEPVLSPEASEQTPYLRTVFLNGDVNDPCVEGCYRPLATGKPGYANVEPGAAFGEACLHQAVCGPVFRGATPDLSRIAFWSEAPLLAGSGEGEEYEWFEGKLSQGNHLPEYRVSKSEDGSWSYFVSGSALAPGADSGGSNLYVSHGGVTKLVAVLSNEDSPDWAGSSGNPQTGVVGDADKNLLTDRTSRVSPDGEWLAFMSDRSLTGYDNEDVTSKSRGERPDEEVYLYHAPESLAGGAGTLVCASCNPSGARPVRP
jgi:NHL repeat